MKNNSILNAKKIVAIGNAGGGKSTLCRTLSQRLNIPLFPIDHIQWEPGWVPVPLEQYAQKHDELIKKSHWIIDGFGPWEYIEQRFAEADTIIYVDLPILTHYWWATKRQLKCLIKPRIDGPPGCPMLPVTFKLYKMMWYVYKVMKPELEKLIRKHQDKNIIHIKNKKGLVTFLDQI